MKSINQESDDTVNRDNAVDYVERVGVKEARNSVHYATAKICHCGTCFCCEVFDVTNKKETTQSDKATARPLNPLLCNDKKSRAFFARVEKRNAKLTDGVKRGEDFIAVRKSEHAALVAVAEAAKKFAAAFDSMDDTKTAEGFSETWVALANLAAVRNQ